METDMNATCAPRDVHELLTEADPPHLIDVREPLEFVSERIPGALNFPLDKLQSEAHSVPKETQLILVCKSGRRAREAQLQLANMGIRTWVLTGGLDGWQAAGLTLRTGRKRLSIMRQVQLSVGLSVVASTVLGIVISQYFFAISIVFGLGLSFAGVTGTCGLARLLDLLPWNRAYTAP
jgi:rhodanese-related sulfurtransferase